MVKKVALFGGSFDPPHNGHKAIIQEVLRVLDIDIIIIMPTFLNPFKKSSFNTPLNRLNLCKIFFKDIKKVVISDYEVNKNSSSFTIDTLNYLNKRYNIEYLIIGADNLKNISKWKDFNTINSKIIWVIATRKDYELDTSKLKRFKVININENISSTEIRKNMELEKRIENIVSVLVDKKAEDIEVFNLDSADYIAKRVVITNSLNNKHTQALFDNLKEILKPKGESFLAQDVSDEWIVADLGDIIIHIMIPEYRQRYALEEFLSSLLEKQKLKEDV